MTRAYLTFMWVKLAIESPYAFQRWYAGIKAPPVSEERKEELRARMCNKIMAL